MKHLREWESRLQPYLAEVELLGEIPLTREEHAELEAAIRQLVQNYKLAEATRLLRDSYPASFVTYLAFKASHNEELGFWDQVAQAIGIGNSQMFFQASHHWGKIFHEIIDRHPNLRRFRKVGGYEFVTPIRLHGGIPAFSLPDFFRYILLPSIDKAPYDGMEDQEALETLLAHYSTELFVDDVVRHFFQHAGSPARQFFSNCRRMARLVTENRLLPSPQELGLRPYVVQAFENYQQNPPEAAVRRRRPRLYFEPYEPGFRILLPQQPLTLEQAGRSFTGRLFDPDNGTVYAEQTRLRPRRSGQEWALEEVEWPLDEPLTGIQVGLFPTGEETPIILYSLRLLPNKGFPPLMAFRYEDGLLRSISPTLPAQELWLLYPSDAEIVFAGQARKIEELHPFPFPWDGWQAGAWDLKQVHQVRLQRAGQDICPPLAVSRLLEPSLTATDLPSQILPVDEKPLYRTPPRLCLPRQSQGDLDRDLAGWSVYLESRHAALPGGKWEAEASSLPREVQGDNILLSLSPWLGEAAAGTYHLTVRQRGRDPLELPFRLYPSLEVENLQPYYLPAGDGAREVTFTVRLAPGHHLCLRSEECAEISPPQGNQWLVKVFPHSSRADLRVEIPTEPEPVSIPLVIAIPRLRWALQLEPGAALEWSHQPVSRPLAELLQTDLSRTRPRLRVELGLLAQDKPLTALHLGLPGIETPLQTSESRDLSAQRVEFDLSAFFDTLRAYPEESVLEFRLELLDASRDLNLQLPVLRFSRELEISTCYFEARPVGWRLHWYEPRPLRHRRLRLWSLWQPWAEPVEIQIPDDAPPSDAAPGVYGWWMTEIPADQSLPLTEYRAHFVAVSPYERNPLPEFPPDKAIAISTISAQDRLRQIEQELEQATPGRRFSLHVEKMCIHHTQEQADLVQKEIQWCLSHWQDANLLHLEALQRWLGNYNCLENRRAFLMNMFRKEKLQELSRYPKDFVARYLSNIEHMHTIKPENAHLILEMAHEPEVILHALRFLLMSDEKLARQYFWEALEQGRFSEADAAQELASKPQFARQLLKEAPDTPLRSRMYRELGRVGDFPELVAKNGHYVLCEAGWGKIVGIRNAAHENLFLVQEETPVLEIELLHWPGQRVEIDLAGREIRLLDRNAAYHCSCGWFVALAGKSGGELWEHHQQFCTHRDFKAIPARFPLQYTPLYRAEKPVNPYNTQIPPGD